MGSSVLTAASSTDAAAAKAGKMDVCHMTSGVPRIVNVAVAAVGAHLRHGDTLVGAEVCDGIDNDCDGQVDEDLGQTTAAPARAR